MGITSIEHRLDAGTPQAELDALIDLLNADPDVDGILVQLPLPKGLDSKEALHRISPAKDVDGFHPMNQGLLLEGLPGLRPCTPTACMSLLAHHGLALKGLRAVVLGRSEIVGKPMALMLLEQHATVTIAHSRTKDLPAVCREADLLVAAVGRPGLVEGSWIKPGAVVVDVGINRIKDMGLGERIFAAEPKKLETLRSKGSCAVRGCPLRRSDAGGFGRDARAGRGGAPDHRRPADQCPDGRERESLNSHPTLTGTTPHPR